MSSTSGIWIPYGPKICKAEQNRQLSRIFNSISSFPRQNLSKTRLASELVIQKTRISKTSFDCKCTVPESEAGPVSYAGERRKKNLAVFVSGGGSNFRSIHEATIGGSVHGNFVALVTDKPGCGAAEYARAKCIPVILFPRTKSSPEGAEGLSPVELVTTLKNFSVDFIILAGYLKLIPPELVQAYPRSIVNIHPSLLPAFGGKGFYGLKVHRAVIASGARYSGPTVHFVDENFDTGLILAQRVVHVLANDTAEELAARVLHEEHLVYVEAVSALCEDRIVWREDGVPLIRSRENLNVYN